MPPPSVRFRFPHRGGPPPPPRRQVDAVPAGRPAAVDRRPGLRAGAADPAPARRDGQRSATSATRSAPGSIRCPRCSPSARRRATAGAPTRRAFASSPTCCRRWRRRSSTTARRVTASSCRRRSIRRSSKRCAPRDAHADREPDGRAGTPRRCGRSGRREGRAGGRSTSTVFAPRRSGRASSCSATRTTRPAASSPAPSSRRWPRSRSSTTSSSSPTRSTRTCSFHGHRHVPFASLGDEVARRTVTFTSATKSWNLAGLCCAVAHYRSRRAARFDRRLSAALFRPGLDRRHRGDRHRLARRRPLAGRAARLSRSAIAHGSRRSSRERLPGIDHVPPEATFLAWLDCRAPRSSRRAVRLLPRARARSRSPTVPTSARPDAASCGSTSRRRARSSTRCSSAWLRRCADRPASRRHSIAEATLRSSASSEGTQSCVLLASRASKKSCFQLGGLMSSTIGRQRRTISGRAKWTASMVIAASMAMLGPG